jgi:hypothetical protein
MEDDRLVRLLRELPRERAEDDFTARVLRRLASTAAGRRERPERSSGLAGRGPRRAAGGPRLMVAGAILATLVIVVALPHREELAPPSPPRTPAASAAPRMAPALPDLPERQASQVANAVLAGRSDAPEESLDRSQARRLLRELRGEEMQLARDLQRLRTTRPRVVYLGGDEDVDMVIDLNRVPEARRAAGPPPT